MAEMNKERLEIARKLRALAGKYVTIGDLEDALGIDMSSPDVDLDRDARDLHRLADLIEPEPERTCRDVGGGDKFVCSKCGASFDYEGRWDEPTYWVDDVAAAVEYCPNCGAKVVSE